MVTKNDKKRNNIFNKRMEQLGFDDVTEWKRRNKIDLSFETCRRAIYEWSQTIRHDYIVKLMQTLDFTLPEIKDELIRRGDKVLHKLITDSGKGVMLNDKEKTLIDKVRRHPDLMSAYESIGAMISDEKKEKTNKEK